MGALDIILIVAVIVLAIGVGFYFFNKWASKRMADQQETVERTKQSVTIYVIDKKKEKVQSANFPKAVQEQLPKWSRLMKMPLVKAKIGAQIMTLMCDSKVFPVLPIKKSVSVELAGMYIVSMKGMKTKKQMQEIRANRKAKPGEAKPSETKHSGPSFRSVLSRFTKR